MRIIVDSKLSNEVEKEGSRREGCKGRKGGIREDNVPVDQCTSPWLEESMSSNEQPEVRRTSSVATVPDIAHIRSGVRPNSSYISYTNQRIFSLFVLP